MKVFLRLLGCMLPPNWHKRPACLRFLALVIAGAIEVPLVLLAAYVAGRLLPFVVAGAVSGLITMGALSTARAGRALSNAISTEVETRVSRLPLSIVGFASRRMPEPARSEFQTEVAAELAAIAAESEGLPVTAWVRRCWRSLLFSADLLRAQRALARSVPAPVSASGAAARHDAASGTVDVIGPDGKIIQAKFTHQGQVESTEHGSMFRLEPATLHELGFALSRDPQDLDGFKILGADGRMKVFIAPRATFGEAATLPADQG